MFTDSRLNMTANPCWLILTSTSMTPKKGVTCCQVFSDSPAAGGLGTARAVVQVQPAVFRSLRGGGHSVAQGPSLPVPRFGDQQAHMSNYLKPSQEAELNPGSCKRL